jgi:hypothetical protein
MNKKSEKEIRVHLRNKWSHLKRQLKERQLLFYKAEIPIELISEYLTKTPSNEEILRIEKVIYEDREEKTKRIKNAIQLQVGHLKSPSFGKIIGTSDTTVRNILSGKKETASYEVIDKLELFLNKNYDFEMSLENNLTVKDFLNSEFDEIIAEIDSIGKSLLRIPFELKKIVDNEKYEYHTNMFFEKKYSPTPIDNLNWIRIEIEEITNKLELKLDNFIKKE